MTHILIEKGGSSIQYVNICMFYRKINPIYLVGIIFLCIFAPVNRTIINYSKLKRFAKLSFLGALLVVSCILTGCQRSSGEVSSDKGSTQIVLTEDQSDSVMSEMSAQLESEVVLDRVKTIYRLVENECNYLGGSVDNDILDKAFCTKSWNKLLMAVRSKEFKTNTLFFEINHWTMTQDVSLINFDEFEVVKCIIKSPKERIASVNFTVYEANSYTPARVDLVYEDGQWKIDNFVQLKYMLNVRSSMLQYLDKDMLDYYLI